MAIRYWPFDSISGDRIHGSDAPARAFNKTLVKNGYVPGQGNELQVTADSPASMNVIINTGFGWIEGRYVEVYSDPVVLTIPTADPYQNRMDRIIMRLNLNTREMEFIVKTGTLDQSPQPPMLERNLDTSKIWELSLAQIFVGATVTQINTENITDERNDSYACGQAIIPQSQLAQIQAELDSHEALTTNAHGGIINAIASSSSQDPNTTLSSYILSNHANSPGQGVYWHILTLFYQSRTGNRSQIAVQYNGSPTNMYIRHYFNPSWESWTKIWTNNNDGPGTGLNADQLDNYHIQKNGAGGAGIINFITT